MYNLCPDSITTYSSLGKALPRSKFISRSANDIKMLCSHVKDVLKKVPGKIVTVCEDGILIHTL